MRQILTAFVGLAAAGCSIAVTTQDGSVDAAWPGDSSGEERPVQARGCLSGTVRLAQAVTCAPQDPTVDGAGALCIRVYATHGAPPPEAPIGSRCAADVQLCGQPPWPYVVEFDLHRAPPGEWVWVSAFLAEVTALSQIGPAPGDPWLSEPLAVPTAAGCVAVPIVLDARY